MSRLLTPLFVFLVLFTSCAQQKDYVVTFKTPYGEMVAILYDDTPKHKENFIKLAREHYFDSMLFHRIIKGFMIQAGDPNSKKAQPGERLGMGGPGYTIPAEFNPAHFHVKGALSAARLGDGPNPRKESSGSQFYIVQGTVLTPADLQAASLDQNKLMTGLRKMFENPANQGLLDSLNRLYYAGDVSAYQRRLFELAPRVEKATGLKVTKTFIPEQVNAYTTIGGSPHLDGEYTVFGKVIRGLEVIDKIAAVETDPGERPLNDVRLAVTVQEMPRKKITKEYGYVYPEAKK